METTKKDKIIADFFNENKLEIADNGFSREVMRKLPIQKDYSWIVWIFSAFGMAISIYLGFSMGLIEQTIRVIYGLPIYYLLAAIISFPLLSGVTYYLVQHKNYQII